MNTFSNTLLRMTAVVALSAGFGMAQAEDTLTATIPFDFVVGKTNLPAGVYRFGSNHGSPVVLIRDMQRPVQVAVMSINPVYRPGKTAQSHITFRVHGRAHYLASTWNAASGTGNILGKTAAERELEMASGPAKEVTLVAQK